MKCINKDSVEYGDLKRSSTLSDKVLDTHCIVFQDKHNRLPRLDEIPGSDSTTYLKDVLKVNKHGGVSNEDLLKFTGTKSVTEAVQNLNSHYSDVQVEAIDFGKRSMLKITKRPDSLVKNIETYYEPSEEITSEHLINGLNTLRELYGYDFKEVTSYELEHDEKWKLLLPSNKTVKAFIYNGSIYINTDNMSPSSRIHEMLHLLVGSIRFSNPELYTSLLQKAAQIPNIEQLIQEQHPDKTQNDALEEIMVHELSRQLAGIPSRLDTLGDQARYEINYNVKRILDTLLFGDYSVNTISDGRLYNMTYQDVAQEVNSPSLTNTFKGTFNTNDSVIHRQLANRKQDLLKSYELIEICR